MPYNYDFSFNPDLSVSQYLVGESQQPVLVIDNVMRDPQSLIEFAASEVKFTPAWNDQGGYPGVRSIAPRNYARSLLDSLAAVVEKTFFFPVRVTPDHANCLLSMVTQPPDHLTNNQRIPHFDTPDTMRIAFLHYLCGESGGGTAFYRHRATGLDVVRADQESEFCRLRDKELNESPPPAAYVTNDIEHFEQTAEVMARFNRLLIYRSQHLHSGVIAPDMNFSADPREGRLTANVFITYRPR